MTVDLTCAESRNDVPSVPRAARIRKIIISNGPDRPRLKMSSPGRLVGQTLSSIISGGPPRNDVLWDSSSIRRVPNEPRPHLSGCQNLSAELQRSKLFAARRSTFYAVHVTLRSLPFSIPRAFELDRVL